MLGWPNVEQQVRILSPSAHVHSPRVTSVKKLITIVRDYSTKTYCNYFFHNGLHPMRFHCTCNKPILLWYQLHNSNMGMLMLHHQTVYYTDIVLEMSSTQSWMLQSLGMAPVPFPTVFMLIIGVKTFIFSLSLWSVS